MAPQPFSMRFLGRIMSPNRTVGNQRVIELPQTRTLRREKQLPFHISQLVTGLVTANGNKKPSRKREDDTSLSSNLYPHVTRIC